MYVEVAVGVERVKLRGHQRLLGLGGWTDRKLDGGGRYGEVEVQGEGGYGDTGYVSLCLLDRGGPGGWTNRWMWEGGTGRWTWK